MKKITGLLLSVVQLIILIAILAGVTPSVLTYIDNLSDTLVIGNGINGSENPAGIAIGSLLAVNALGGILWFALVILIITAFIFFTIKRTKSK